MTYPRGFKRVVGAVLELEILGPELEGRAGGWRTPKVRVLAAHPAGSEGQVYRSLREASFTYVAGEVVEARGWDELGNEGIYYYKTFAEARRY